MEETAGRDAAELIEEVERSVEYSDLVKGLKQFQARVQALKRPDVNELTSVLTDASSVLFSAIEYAEKMKNVARKARASAFQAGQRLRGADQFELRRLADAGLVDHEVVEREALRRRGLQRMPSWPVTSDAVIAGEMPCGHPECNRIVPAADIFCTEHAQEEPRAELVPSGMGYRLRDYDKEVHIARLEAARLEDALREAKEELAAAEAAVEAWDAHRG